VDGSPTSNRGFKVALDMARVHKARLVALHVIDERAIGIGLSASGYVAPAFVEGMIDAMRRSGKSVLAKAQRDAKAAGQSIDALLIESLGNGVAHTVLVQARKTKADLIVLGTHGRRGLTRIVMGSDAETVVREASVPVLLVRTPTRTAAKRRSA
jgi:nucleotide-binding universal stress UspA family protein